MSVENKALPILTLDAGGTNFMFSAWSANREIIEPLCLPAEGHDFDLCFGNMVKGFKAIMSRIQFHPAAISVAIPGPVDQDSGIIGKLTNLTSFSGEIPLRAMLENEFQIPVFIHNDGDLFAFGESQFGFLSEINEKLREKKINKVYHNLIGLTLGTGFGAGIVRNNDLFLGDNSMATEVWLMQNHLNHNSFAEEGISIRAIKKTYSREAVITFASSPAPDEIYEIALGKKKGNQEAAKTAFEELGQVLGNVLCTLLTLFDGPVIIGGGISGAMSLIYPSVFQVLRSRITGANGTEYPRVSQEVFNMDSSPDKDNFYNWPTKSVDSRSTSGKIFHLPGARIPIGTTRIGTHHAISLGAYSIARQKLDRI